MLNILNLVPFCCVPRTPANLFAAVLLGFGALSHAVAASGEVDAQSKLSLYETKFTPLGKQRFTNDPNEWVFKSEFGERYNMPPQWADEGLTGVDALAHRVKWATGKRCGFKDAPVCRARVQCLVEIYLPRAEDFPIKNNLEVNFDMFSRDYSMRYLVPQSTADKKARADLRQSVQLAGGALYAFRDESNHAHYSPIYVTQYDRRFYQRDNITLGLNCDWLKHARQYKKSFRILLGKKGSTDADLKKAYLTGYGEEQQAVWRSINIPKSALSRWHKHKQQLAWEPAYYDVHADQPWLGGPTFEQSEHSYVKRYENYAARVADDVEDSTPLGKRQKPSKPLPKPTTKNYDEDMNVWGYTRAFANRFGMPEQWIEPDMGDALAVVFRLERNMNKTCGMGFNLKNCSRDEICMVDIYLPDDAPVPWFVDWPVAHQGTDEDAGLLYTRTIDTEQAEQARRTGLLSTFFYGGGFEDQPVTQEATTIAYQWGTLRPKKLFGVKYWQSWFWGGSPVLGVYRHEKRFPGMQVLTINKGCRSRGSWERAKIRDDIKRDTRILFFPRPIDINKLYFKDIDTYRLEKPEFLVEVKNFDAVEYRWYEHQTRVHRLSKKFEKRAKELAK